MVVLGFGGLFVCIVGAAVFQLRRVLRSPGGGPADPETGALDPLKAGGPH
jgi:hypothetical protein